jgi:hypothetical protein
MFFDFKTTFVDFSFLLSITPHRLDFETYTPCNGTVCLGDKSMIDQVGVGSVIFKTSLGTPITLSNVLHLPEVKTHFMSMHTLAQKGADVFFFFFFFF